MSHKNCPNCGFDFKKVEPSKETYVCTCKEFGADITSDKIEIICFRRPNTCGYHSRIDITDLVFSEKNALTHDEFFSKINELYPTKNSKNIL